MSQLLLLSRSTSHPTAPALQSAQHCSEKPRWLLCPPLRSWGCHCLSIPSYCQQEEPAESGWSPSSPHCEHSQGGCLANFCLSKARLQWNITVTPKKQRLQEYHFYLSRCSNSIRAKPRNNCKADPICISVITKWRNLAKCSVAKNLLCFKTHFQHFRVTSPSQSTGVVCFCSVCRWPLKDLHCLSLLPAVTWRERTAII